MWPGLSVAVAPIAVAWLADCENERPMVKLSSAEMEAFANPRKDPSAELETFAPVCVVIWPVVEKLVVNEQLAVTDALLFAGFRTTTSSMTFVVFSMFFMERHVLLAPFPATVHFWAAWDGVADKVIVKAAVRRHAKKVEIAFFIGDIPLRI